MPDKNPSSGVRIFFHFSPVENRYSIASNGLAPVFSQGLRQVVWLCAKYKTSWARKHVARWKKCSTHHLDMWVVSVQRRSLRLIRNGVYICRDHIPPNALEIARLGS